MKTILPSRKRLTLLAAGLAMLFPLNGFAQIDITSAFTDANFKDAVYQKIDKASPDPIYDTDVSGITHLDVVFWDIADLSGIEYFIALQELQCQSNRLTALDVSNNTALLNLYCIDNRLTALDVSNNTVLKELHCDDNQLTALDVSSNTTLQMLSCSNNQLTVLDVSNNTNLEYLFCDNNQLTALDVSSSTTLQVLSCRNNQLTALDISNNLKLLFCDDNQLTTLDVSSNTNLQMLSCFNNQLTVLDVSNNTNLEYLFCGNNQLTTLDISYNERLLNLVCGDNQLTTLDVSYNFMLRHLHCSNNRLTALYFQDKFGKNVACPQTIDCSNNLLTTLSMRHVSPTSGINGPQTFYCDNNYFNAANPQNDIANYGYSPDHDTPWPTDARLTPQKTAAVAVTPATPSVTKGTTQAFSASVTSSAADVLPPTVTWSVSGNNSAGTAIDSGGELQVAVDETASTLTVTATSGFKSTFTGIATVTVTTGAGIANIAAADPVISTQYYTLQGIALKEPQAGRIYIIKEIRQSGRVTINKRRTSTNY
jgi:Leucine-rich repeat (LRR) protein